MQPDGRARRVGRLGAPHHEAPFEVGEQLAGVDVQRGEAVRVGDPFVGLQAAVTASPHLLIATLCRYLSAYARMIVCVTAFPSRSATAPQRHELRGGRVVDRRLPLAVVARHRAAVHVVPSS